MDDEEWVRAVFLLITLFRIPDPSDVKPDDWDETQPRLIVFSLVCLIKQA